MILGFVAACGALAVVSFVHVSDASRWAIVAAGVVGALLSVGWQLRRRAQGTLYSTERPTVKESSKSVRLWGPIGAEEDAYFTIDATGYALADGGFNACLVFKRMS